MKILFAGDVMLGRLVNKELRTRPAEHPWGNVMPLFKGADLRVCNLECAISDRGEPWAKTPKAFHFRTDAKNVNVLKAANINAVSLANNHTFDFGYEAAFDTIDILDREGICHAGAGREIGEAARPSFLNAGGLKIGFIAFTDNEPAWEAHEDSPGIFYVPVDAGSGRARKLFDLARDTKMKADILIVSAHWGPNRGYTPVPGHIPFAHALIDSGADIVFGHSCHVFQGVELYKGRPIIYSAGDFVDDYAVDEAERNDESFVFIVEAGESGIKKIRLYPTMIIRFQARRAASFLAEEIAFKMKRLCTGFNTHPVWIDGEECLEISI